MDSTTWTVESEPDAGSVAFLEDRINEYNFSTTGITDGRQLALFVRDENGAIHGGLYGWTWGGTCEVRFLWIEAGLRRGGIGRRLLGEAEAEAVRRGCRQIVLNTHSFQAPEFYRKQGYSVVGQYDDYPEGQALYFLRKTLGA